MFERKLLFDLCTGETWSLPSLLFF